MTCYDIKQANYIKKSLSFSPVPTFLPAATEAQEFALRPIELTPVMLRWRRQAVFDCLFNAVKNILVIMKTS